MYDVCNPSEQISTTYPSSAPSRCQDEPVDDGRLRARGVHEDVLEKLGPDLLWGELSTVDDLRLELIEDRYGVSRTAAREVIRVLEAMGVVTSRRRVGITVRPRQEWNVLDPRLIRWRLAGPERAGQLRSLSQLRAAVEPVSAALAAQHATPAQCGDLTAAVIGMSVTGQAGDLDAYLEHDVLFHSTLLRASGNELFAALTDVVAEVLAGRTHHDLMPSRPDPAAIRLHGDVAEAVSAGDAPRAEAAMRAILAEAQEAMEQAFPGDDRQPLPSGAGTTHD
jgi:DNA-binding FadR family transcriptional regulator